MRAYFPHASNQVINHIANTLYPPVYDGSQPYTSAFSRLDLVISEMMVSCNSRFLATGLGVGLTYAYQFSVPPGLHMDDIPYTFYDGVSSSVSNATVATSMQRYIVSFAITGDPNAAVQPDGLPSFPVYGPEGSLTNFNTTFIDVEGDPNNNPRCDWWQRGQFL